MKPLFFMFIGLIFAFSILQAKISDESWEKVEKYYYLSQTITNDPWIRFDLAMVFAYTGFVEEGFKQLADIASMDTGQTFASKVLRRYKRKSERNPFNWEYHFYFAFALYFNDRNLESIKELEKAASLVKEQSIQGWCYGYMAYIYGEKKMWPQAMTAIKTAIELEPDGAALYFAKGYALKETGDNVGAASAIFKAGTLKATQMLGRHSIRRLKKDMLDD